MTRVVVVCGPPAAGKTTLADRLGLPVLHSDDYARDTYERMAADAAATGGPVVVDGTFYRREWLERFRGRFDVYVVHVTATLVTCLRRNREREDPISERGVRVVHAEFEDPDPDVVVDTDVHGPEAAARLATGRVADWLSRRDR